MRDGRGGGEEGECFLWGWGAGIGIGVVGGWSLGVGLGVAVGGGITGCWRLWGWRLEKESQG